VSKLLTPYALAVLKYLRKNSHRKLTLQEIADYFGVSRKSVYKVRLRLVMRGFLPNPTTGKYLKATYLRYERIPLGERNPKLMNPLCATPQEVSQILLENEDFEGGIWDPASGTGALSGELEKKFGACVRATDIASGTDFLKTGIGPDFLHPESERAENIVVHPPILESDAFMKRAFSAAKKKIAIFLPFDLLEKARGQKPDGFRLKSVHVISKLGTLRRMWPKKAPKSAILTMGWFVWEKGHQGPPLVNYADKRKAKEKQKEE
jgi:HTH domain